MSLRRSSRTKLFRATCNVLQSDPYLKSANLDWRVWEGDPAKDQPDGSTATGTWLRLSPDDGGEWTWAMTRTLKGEFQVKVEIWSPGTRREDLLDLWSAIEDAVYPPDLIRRQNVMKQYQIVDALKTVSLTNVRCASFEIESPKDGTTGVKANGVISMTMYLQM